MTTEHRNQQRVAVIGGGPAGLAAAEVIASAGHPVTVYERMPTIGRKFLLAGRGGLNLTHSEDIARFLPRYGKASAALSGAIERFPPEALRAWCEGLGQETFIGSSGRVFPKSMKASPLLRAWARRLTDLGVVVLRRHLWQGWDGEHRLLFETLEGPQAVTADAVVLALGGASWPHLGSDGTWTRILSARDVAVTNLAPANCGVLVPWSELFYTRHAGTPLKRIGLACGTQHVRGEALVTKTGLEGGAVYALSSALRDDLARGSGAQLAIDLRPDMTLPDIERRLSSPRGKQSFATFLRKTLRMAPVEIALLQEVAHGDGIALSSCTPAEIAARIKALSIRVTAMAPIDRAISTAGGIAFAELDQHFMLKRLPGVFAAGEMLDWEAPTGGYLLQACFATGRAAGEGVAAWLAARS